MRFMRFMRFKVQEVQEVQEVHEVVMYKMNILEQPLTPADEELLAIYTSLKSIAARPDLAPCVERNVKKALACMWQVVNDLNLEYEQLYDVGV